MVNPFKPAITDSSDTESGNTPNGESGDTGNGSEGSNNLGDTSNKPAKATDLEKDIKSLEAITKAFAAINKRNTKQPLIGADMVTSIADLLAACQAKQAQIAEKYAAIEQAADAESAAQKAA